MWMPHVLAARVCWERLAIQTTDCLRLSKFNSDHPWCQVPPNVKKDRLLHHETHFGTPSTTPATTHQGIASTWQEQMESGRLNDNPLKMELENTDHHNCSARKINGKPPPGTRPWMNSTNSKARFSSHVCSFCYFWYMCSYFMRHFSHVFLGIWLPQKPCIESVTVLHSAPGILAPKMERSDAFRAQRPTALASSPLIRHLDRKPKA